MLRDLSFLKIGGTCNAVFEPTSTSDLQQLLKKTNDNILCLGAMSNVLLYDGHIDKSVILTKKMNNIRFSNNQVFVEAGCSIASFIKICVDNNISCIEDMLCIPGTIGGAIIMNAGIQSFEIFDVVKSIQCLDRNGNTIILQRDNCSPQYRNGNIPAGLIVTSCILQTKKADNDLRQKISNIMKKRNQTQPIGSFTCGSTFKNPTGYKAWELIDSVGCRGMQIGGAAVSDLHCNFIINNGNATFSDVIQLINTIKQRVYAKHGIVLEEEIKIIT